MDTTVISALAALVGSFVGAFFKEQIADWFFSSKKKKEIRSELIKNVVQYLGYAKELTSVNNHHEYHNAYLRKMKDYLESTVEPEKSQLQKERDEIINMLDRLAQSGFNIYEKVLECESSIVAISMECEHYFERPQYIQLRNTVKHIRHYTSSLDSKLLKDYKTLPFSKMTVYKVEQYEKSMLEIFNDIEKSSERYESHINEILQIEPFWKRKWFK